MTIADLPARPRVALVLGAPVLSGGQPSPALLRRAQLAVELVRAGEVDCLLACGGIVRHGPAEAEVIRAIALAAGVPDQRIFVETRSRTTAENLRNAKPILARLTPGEIVAVTDRFHAPRVRLMARRLGLMMRVSTPEIGSVSRTRRLRTVLREAIAYAAYAARLRGR